MTTYISSGSGRAAVRRRTGTSDEAMGFFITDSAFQAVLSKPSGDGIDEQLIARFPNPTVDGSTRIAVIGDPHVSTRGEGGQRLPEFSEQHLERAVSDIDDRGFDAAFSVGDLSANGGPWDFDAVDGILEGLDIPFVSIPGNHDVPATSSADHEVLPRSRFETRYAGGTVPFVREFDDVEMVGLDSMRLRASLAAGESGEQVQWLDETLSGTEDPIVALHHPLPGITDWLMTYNERVDGADISRLWQNVDPLVDVLDAHDVSLVLSGHKHIPGVAQTRDVWEVMAPSTCTFPQGYLGLEVTPDGTDVTFVPVASAEGLEEAFLRRYNAFTKTRTYASAGAVFLSGPPVDARSGDG